MHTSPSESPRSSGARTKSPRLGELLVEMSLITPEQLRVGLELQKTDGRRLGSILVDQGVINETRLVKALSKQLGIDVCDPITAPVHEMVRSKVSRQSARELRVVPIAVKRDESGDRLFVATSDPLNADARLRLQRETSMRVEWLLAGETELELALARHYGTQRPSFVLESLPPSSARSAPVVEAEPELDIHMELPVEASIPPDVSDALEPILDEAFPEALQLSGRQVSPTPTPDLLPYQARRFTPSVPPGQPSWGEIVAKPPSDPSSVLLGPTRPSRSSPPPPRPIAAPSRPSDDPYIEAVDHLQMTGDLLPASRVLRSSATPDGAPIAPRAFVTPSAPLPASWSPRPSAPRRPSAEDDAIVDIEEVEPEPPLLELSEAEILPPGTGRASSIPAASARNGAPEATAPRISDLSGLDVDGIAAVLSESVEAGDPVALMVSSPPPQPTPEQEVRMLAAQVRQEARDFIAGDVNAEARTRVLRTLVAILEDEGFLSDERVQRAVRRVLLVKER